MEKVVTYENAKAVARHLAKAIHPVSIIAFGSVAQYGEGNDLDLLVVTEDTSEDLQQLFQKVHTHLKPFYKDYAIDPFVLPRSRIRDHLLKGSPFLRLIQRSGRCLYMKDSAKQWISQAKEELSTAQYLCHGVFYRSACYHGQQATEKALKGALIQKGWELEKIHSIERLMVIGEKFDIDLQMSEEAAIFIDSVYRGRYPAEEGLLPTGEPKKEDAERIILIASDTINKLFP